MPKPRLCKCGCGEPIPDGNTLRKAATIECALKLVRVDTQKKECKVIREARRKLKTRREYVKDAQQAFNSYIRCRDTDLPCISCGNFTPETRGGDYDCGHYRSVGANPELRFDEDNAHKQCKRCNSHLSGNIVNYRIGLLMRIGDERVEKLEGPHPARKYTILELQAIKDEYKQKLKALKTNPVYPV
jgi:hypothetical protein